MTYVFYADVFFLTNCYLDFLAVYAVGELLNQKKRLLRYLIVSALGSLAGCVLFAVLQDYDMYLLCMHFMINPGLVFCCFFPAEKRIYAKAFCLMYFVVLLLGGSVEWMYVTVCGRTYYELCLFFTLIPVTVFLYILRKKRKSVQCFCRVWIKHKEKEIALPALYDTGNRLIDPYIKEPVHIVPKDVYETFGGMETFGVRLIPFSSVGCKNGMLQAFTVDSIRMENEGAVYEISPAVLAAAEEEIFKGRAYRMILNSESMERKEEKICT